MSMRGDKVASGDYSTALGCATTAQAFGAAVLGQYNMISGNEVGLIGTDPRFVIGNGSDWLDPRTSRLGMRWGSGKEEPP